MESTTEQGKLAPKMSVKLSKYFEVIAGLELLDKRTAELKKEKEELGEDLISQMNEENLQQIRDDGGRLLYLGKPGIYASINKDNEEEAVKTLKDKWGLSALFKEQIPAQTLNRVIKERLEDGQDIPEHLFKVFTKQKLGHRRK